MSNTELRSGITFADNTIGQDEIDAVTAVLRSGWLSADRLTRAFEQGFADAAGVPDAVFVSSGTAALHLSVLALGLQPGDEVIMPSLSFVAAAEVCALHGVVPVFADVRSDVDLTVDPGDVQRLIGPRTKAIVVMHYGGHAAATSAVTALGARQGIVVIEDSAHAPLVETPEGTLGTIGDIGCFSFFATKNLTTGEGGMVVAKDSGLLKRIRSMRSHHIDGTSRSRAADPTIYDIAEIGLNYRPTEISAAIGSVQLSKMSDDRRRRRGLVAAYHDRLRRIPGLVTPFAGRGGDSAHHLLPILLPAGVDRRKTRDLLLSAGVPTSVHYPPTHALSYYRDDPDGLRTAAIPREDLPITASVAARLLSLPLHAKMTRDDVSHVTDRVAEYVGHEGDSA